MAVVMRPKKEVILSVAGSAYAAVNDFCEQRGIRYDGPSKEALNQIQLTGQQFEKHCKTLDAAKSASYFSGNRNYLYQSNVFELMRDHGNRMAQIRSQLTESVNACNQDVRRQAEAILAELVTAEDKAAFRALMTSVNQTQQDFVGSQFDDWAAEEQQALLQAHYKNQSQIIFRPEGVDQISATLMGVGLNGIEKINVELRDGRKDFAQIGLKDGKPNKLSFNIYYYEHGDNDWCLPMYWLPWRKSNSNTNYNTFSHSAWRSLWRDKQGRQKLGGLGGQAEFMVDVYEETFKDTPDLQQKPVDILNADARVIMQCAKAFIKRGYKISQQTYQALSGNQFQSSNSNNSYAAELKHYEESMQKQHRTMRDKAATQHRILATDSPILTAEQEAVRDILDTPNPAGPTV